MDIHEVDVYITTDGRVRIEVRGLAGEACLALTRALEAALGDDVLDRQRTPDAGDLGDQLAPPNTLHVGQ